MNKKILVVILGIVLFSGIVSANIIATMGMQGLNFINPQINQAVRLVLCVTVDPLSCVEQYVEGKIVSSITGEIFDAVAQISPEAAKAILTYNQIKGYINQGATILEDLSINNQGQIEQGILDFNEEEYSLNDFLVNSTAEDLVVSNVKYDFLNKEVTIKENGFLKLKFKDEQGNEKEFLYTNIKDGGKFKLNDKGEIEEAWFFSSKHGAEFEFLGFDKLVVEKNAEIVYKDGKITVKGNEFLYGDNLIKILGNISQFAEIEGDNLKCVNCKVGDIYLRKLGAIPASIDILNKGFLVNYGKVNYKQNQFDVVTNNVLIANSGVNMVDYPGNWIRQTTNILEIQSSEDGWINIKILEDHEILRTVGSDNLYIDVNRGDGLLFEQRETQGLIPRAVHRSSINGIAHIKNNEISFELSENGLLMESPKPLTTEDFLGNRHQSVAFEIESDSHKIDTKVRFNSYGQFAILSNEDNEIIKYNLDGFPISARARDNELTKIELRKRLIEEREYVIPKEVMGSFAGIVDPNRPFDFVPSGGHMNADHLTSRRERNQFISELKKLGYNDDEINSFIDIFREGNIVLSEHVLIKEQNFVKVLAHERLHRDILNSNDESMLNEARDFIIDDLKTKEIRIVNEVSKFIPEYNEGKISFEEYKMEERKIIEKHNPILLDRKGEIGIDIVTIINRPDEFYAYLYDGRLNPSVEKYLRLNFPDSYRIYLQLTERIYGQINNRINSIFD